MKNAKKEIKFILKRVRATLLLAMPVLVVCALLCLYTLKVLESTIINDSSALINAVEQNIDSRLIELVRCVKQTELSSENRNIKSIETPANGFSTQMYRLSVKIKDSISTNNLIDGMYIYYPHANIVVSESGCFKPDAYYILAGLPSRNGYEEWIDYLLKPHKGEYCSIQMSRNARFGYIEQLKSGNDLRAVYVIEINKSVLSDLLDSNTLNNNYASGILLNGSPVVYSGDIQNLIDFEAYKTSTDNSVIKSDGNYVFLNPSYFPGLQYITAHTSHGLLQSVRIVAYICIFVFTGCFVFIIIISIWLGNKEKSSIKELINKVGGNDAFPDTDEYSYISSKIDQLISDKYKNEQQMSEYQNRLNSLFLTNIFQNKCKDESGVFTVAKRYGVSFDYSYYRVIILEGDFDLSDSENLSYKLQKSVASDSLDCLVSYNNRAFFILLNSDNSDTDESAIITARRLLDETFEDMSARGGIGALYDTAIGIRDSYRQAMEALNTISMDTSHNVKLYTLVDSTEGLLSTEDNTKSGQRAKREQRIAEKAKEIIDRDFDNPSMGLYLVSERLNVSNSYLSTAFKSTYKENIISYINRLRVEKAKDLILTTDKSIKEIATLTGFSSDINFIRVFKKFENRTPSTLRNIESQD